jgi:cytosine/uracil/thiamine/allantoin permease
MNFCRSFPLYSFFMNTFVTITVCRIFFWSLGLHPFSARNALHYYTVLQSSLSVKIPSHRSVCLSLYSWALRRADPLGLVQNVQQFIVRQINHSSADLFYAFCCRRFFSAVTLNLDVNTRVCLEAGELRKCARMNQVLG